MRIYSLDEVYADRRASTIQPDQAAHRQRVKAALAPEEPIYAYWWDRDITGLVLFTDRQIVQIPRFIQRKMLFGFTTRYETWHYPYASLTGVDYFAGGMLELPRLILHRKAAQDALIILNGGKRPDHEALAAALRELLAAWQAAPHITPPDEEHPTLTDTAAQLRELYDLYRAGALDEDEYRRAKARLLAD